jgi:hypothetical protein
MEGCTPERLFCPLKYYKARQTFATIDYLQNELTLIDRLDGMIDRCIKRLLLP